MDYSRIAISTIDHSRLEPMVRDAIVRGGTPNHLTSALKSKLDHGRILPPEKMPKDVVTMNSMVSLRDLDLDEVETFTLVYPSFANIAGGCLSVLTPIGAAILGHRKGDIAETEIPFGSTRVEIEDVQFQPESVGQYDV